MLRTVAVDKPAVDILKFPVYLVILTYPRGHPSTSHRVALRDIGFNIDYRRAVKSIEPLNHQYILAALKQPDHSYPHRVRPVR